MAATKFDMRHFLREIALSKTYQRSSELPAGVKEVSAKSPDGGPPEAAVAGATGVGA